MLSARCGHDGLPSLWDYNGAKSLVKSAKLLHHIPHCDDDREMMSGGRDNDVHKLWLAKSISPLLWLYRGSRGGCMRLAGWLAKDRYDDSTVGPNNNDSHEQVSNSISWRRGFSVGNNNKQTRTGSSELGDRPYVHMAVRARVQ